MKLRVTQIRTIEFRVEIALDDNAELTEANIRSAAFDIILDEVSTQTDNVDIDYLSLDHQEWEILKEK